MLIVFWLLFEQLVSVSFSKNEEIFWFLQVIHSPPLLSCDAENPSDQSAFTGHGFDYLEEILRNIKWESESLDFEFSCVCCSDEAKEAIIEAFQNGWERRYLLTKYLLYSMQKGVSNFFFLNTGTFGRPHG